MVTTNHYQALPLEGVHHFCFGVRKFIVVRSVTQSFAAVVGENVRLLHRTEFPRPIG